MRIQGHHRRLRRSGRRDHDLKNCKSDQGRLRPYSTYGWHPRTVAAALANLRYLARHRNKLIKNATELGQYFLTRLSQMSSRGKATVRGKGFAIGIEVKDVDYASEVGDACRENGLFVSAEDDVLMLFPADHYP